uniref:Protein DGCR6-like n=1 Tax=Sinocyclocheilus grahami TaxID=75366 RepID=A0A672P2G2_SINGR
MDMYSGVRDNPSDAARQQERHYYLLSELQTLVKDLPSSFQQRLSYTTLSDLAQALIDGTVYEIVQGLLDIQHLTEKNLYNQRQKLHSEHRALKQDLVRKHKQALQTCKSHNLAVLKTNQRAEAEALDQRVKEEQRMMDEKVVAEMDQKVLDQQNTLEKAGVPGFYITTNPQVSLTLTLTLSPSQRRLRSFFQTLSALSVTGGDDADEFAGTGPEAAAERDGVWISALKEPDTSRASQFQHEISVDDLFRSIYKSLF